MRMPRREFLKAVGAASTIAAIPGCATMGGASAKVVVVGGGYGGATAAKYIRMWGEGRIDVTVVEPYAEFISCPTVEPRARRQQDARRRHGEL